MMRATAGILRSLSRYRLIATALLAGACSDGGITPPPAATPNPAVAATAEAEIASSAASSNGGISTGSLTNGGTHTGTISVAGQTDNWTFTATQGQYLIVSIGELSGSDFTPWIRILDPNGATIGNTWNTAAAQLGIAAPLTGTYTVLAASNDVGNDGTGTYQLTAAQLQGSFIVSPGDEGGAMTNGSNHVGTHSMGDSDFWRFTAAQGDNITVAIGEVSGSADYTPWIRVIGPNGALLANTWNTAAAQANLVAPLAGEYTVVTSTADVGNDGTGTYSLTLAKNPGAITISPGDQGGPMTNGSSHLGTLLVGDLDAWTFSANQGDYISLGVGELTGNDFTPWIRLVSPNGTLVGNTWNTASAQLGVNAPLTGTYMVVVSSADVGNDGSGDYSLSLATQPGGISISPGDQGGAMTNGSTHLGTLTVGDQDAWTFSATQGDYITLGIGEMTGTDFTPWIRLVSPNGTLIGNTWNTDAAQLGVNATLTGTYMVIVGSADVGNDGLGDYRLTLAKGPGSITISPGDQGGPMTNGAIHNGTLTNGDQDAFTFAANQGDAIAVSIGEVTGTDFTPWIRLISPTGALLANTWNTDAAQLQVNAPATGNYLVVVGSADVGNDGIGDYILTLAKAPGAITTSPGDQGGAATNGGNNLGTILRGDIDVYTFNTNAGLPFAVSIGEITGTGFNPWIRVISPNGTMVGNTWNTDAAQYSAIAPLSGTYTVIIGSADVGNDGSGDYRLIVQKSGPFVTPPGDEGGALAIGAIATGTIDRGDLDRWTFAANQGDYIAVNVGEITGTDFTPWIRLVSPSGVVLGNTWNVAGAQISVVAAETGTYTIAVGTADVGNDGNGTYRLNVAKGPGAFVVSPGDEGGSITNGNQSGTIQVGDLDMWSFTANQGSALSMTVSEVTGTDFTPWIRLVAPNGALLGNNWGATSGTINVAAPSTGTYTIILGSADVGNDGSGTYNLSLGGVNLMPQPDFVPVTGQLKAGLSPRPKSYGLDGR